MQRFQGPVKDELGAFAQQVTWNQQTHQLLEKESWIQGK